MCTELFDLQDMDKNENLERMIRKDGRSESAGGGCENGCDPKTECGQDTEYCQDAERYMRLALELAKQGEGHTSPNPMVGCVVVKDGRIIGEGYHERYGKYHAERNALTHLKEDAAGADLYVTLEPCCHYGKTPPCTEIILECGIARVFIGCMDPNPKVAGKGLRILREHGVEVYTGILEDECYRLNEVFFHYITDKKPFVAVKYAMTLDGKIAAYTGDSRWVTGEEARRHTHMLRKRYTGIMVGIGTVLADDPLLNCRTEEGVDPVRIVCDSKLRIPLDSRIVKTAREIPTIVAYVGDETDSAGETLKIAESTGKSSEKTKSDEEISKQTKNVGTEGLKENENALSNEKNQADEKLGRKKKLYRLSEAGITCLPVLGKHGKKNNGDGIRDVESGIHLDLHDLLEKLGARGIDGILVEGGGTLNSALFEENLVDRVYAYIAPKIIGGSSARTPVEGQGIEKMCDAVKLEETAVLKLGEDICVTGLVKR